MPPLIVSPGIMFEEQINKCRFSCQADFAENIGIVRVKFLIDIRVFHDFQHREIYPPFFAEKAGAFTSGRDQAAVSEARLKISKISGISVSR